MCRAKFILSIPLMKDQPEERLSTTTELNLASCLVTGCGEARGRGYWAATQVKGLSPESPNECIPHECPEYRFKTCQSLIKFCDYYQPITRNNSPVSVSNSLPYRDVSPYLPHLLNGQKTTRTDTCPVWLIRHWVFYYSSSSITLYSASSGPFFSSFGPSRC